MENKLVELLNKESSFAYGFLLYEDKEKILINNLDDQGRFDGYTLISKDLVQVNKKSDFLKKLKIFCCLTGQLYACNEMYLITNL